MREVCELDLYRERVFRDSLQISLSGLAVSVRQAFDCCNDGRRKALSPQAVKRDPSIFDSIVQQRGSLLLFGIEYFRDCDRVLDIVRTGFIDLPVMGGGCQPQRPRDAFGPEQ